MPLSLAHDRFTFSYFSNFLVPRYPSIYAHADTLRLSHTMDISRSHVHLIKFMFIDFAFIQFHISAAIGNDRSQLNQHAHYF